jgi:hypothetical protein
MIWKMASLKFSALNHMKYHTPAIWQSVYLWSQCGQSSQSVNGVCACMSSVPGRGDP